MNLNTLSKCVIVISRSLSWITVIMTLTLNYSVKGNQKGKVTCYARERVNKNELF